MQLPVFCSLVIFGHILFFCFILKKVYLQQLEELRCVLEQSQFFMTHEVRHLSLCLKPVLSNPS